MVAKPSCSGAMCRRQALGQYRTNIATYEMSNSRTELARVSAANARKLFVSSFIFGGVLTDTRGCPRGRRFRADEAGDFPKIE